MRITPHTANGSDFISTAIRTSTHANRQDSAQNTTQAKTYSGSCFCGAVQFTVSGEPAAMGYCHCESCRSWSAGPVNAFTLWKPDAVKVTRGAEQHRHLQQDAEELPQVVQDRAAATCSPSIRMGI